MRRSMHHDPPALQTVLFDLDGTLIATRRLYIEALSRALEPVVGRRLTEADIMSHVPKAERRFLQRMAGEERFPSVLETFYRAYHDHHEPAFQGVYPGVLELLAELRRRGLRIGLVTGKSRRAWEITERHAGLGSFHTVVVDDDVPHPKPDPAGVHLAIERLGADPATTAYVGDSLTDLEAATAAGVRAGAVLWSKKPEEVEVFTRESRARGAFVLRDPAALRVLTGSPPAPDVPVR
jgi:pyrophosphatase PpaX